MSGKLLLSVSLVAALVSLFSPHGERVELLLWSAIGFLIYIVTEER
jgi:hypothetical protein